MIFGFLNTQIVRAKRCFGYVFPVAAVLLVSSCSDYPDGLETVAEYQQRLTYAQDLPPLEVELAYPKRMPVARELNSDIERLSLSLIDAWRLDECPAGALIAERNSALGRLTDGVLRYYNDLKMLEALRLCAADVTENSTWQVRLTAAINAKQEQLPQLRQQAIATDDALRHSLSPAATPLASADDARLAPTLAAFEVVLTVFEYRKTGDQLPSFEQLESALENLQNSSYLPGYWRSLHDKQHYLAALAPLLTGVSERAGCLSKGTPERAKILRNIFTKFFASELQPQLAGFVSQGYQLTPLLERLQAQSTHPEVTQYLNYLAELPMQLTTTTRAHAQQWQEFFRDCDFVPGA
ncbi:Protein of unknown function [Pseudidiomarina planktonica]|uniref:DUF3080 domain-containing protein n=1 Tax=Pseudidiomarina planktonica TaxID=1323738 RepID=A0A1Y6EY13_9GAMM|nr:DUF3080 family protein [Pseudidiomarina planktonica]RUO65400.1 DUF3080 domain-containing protein [Pseudidiomarina planktonica]SMQ65163.1 Protein of unknown function [Pseudidiomarina planktonica]